MDLRGRKGELKLFKRMVIWSLPMKVIEVFREIQNHNMDIVTLTGYILIHSGVPKAERATNGYHKKGC